MKPFRFMNKYDQTVLLGRRAGNLIELLHGIEAVPTSSIFFHTHKSLQQQYRLAPEPPNDFAFWITNKLGYERFGEQLASVDIVQFRSIDDLRNTFIAILRQFLEKNPHTDNCVPGHEFHFMSCQTFVLPTHYTASSLAEFKQCLKHVSVNTLRYHILDRTLRGGNGNNDFSAWFMEIEQHSLADQIAQLDPYTQTMEGLRNRILQLVEHYEKD